MDMFIGVVIGFFIGVLFIIYLTDLIGNRVAHILYSKISKVDKEPDHDDGANFWKPDDWRPDSLD